MQSELNRQIILDKTKSNSLIKEVCFNEETTSTNDLARVEAEKGAQNGTLYIAERQTNGKGRFKRKWVSPNGKGIWATLLLRPKLEVRYSTGYSVLCGVAICKAIKEVTGLNTQIKWPNDIVINGKKLCGILAEMGSKNGYIDWIAIGFGVNVNISEFENSIADKATSVSIEKGEDVSRLELLAKILEQFNILFDYYEKTKSLAFISKDYALMSCVINKNVEIIEGSSSKRGFVIGFDDEGALILKTENGLERIKYGEVSIRSEGLYK